MTHNDLIDSPALIVNIAVAVVLISLYYVTRYVLRSTVTPVFVGYLVLFIGSFIIGIFLIAKGYDKETFLVPLGYILIPVYAFFTGIWWAGGTGLDTLNWIMPVVFLTELGYSLFRIWSE
jgi:hypothetical protein